MSAEEFAAKKTVRLTTRGRRSGSPRTVSLWFVAAGPRRILVQHASSARANWYHNLRADPAVTLDFGSGAISAHGAPITDDGRIQEVLAMVRGKYWMAWLIQLIGRRAQALAAEITW